jgi:E3 ubiquitin-protein ligase HECTD2
MCALVEGFPDGVEDVTPRCVPPAGSAPKQPSMRSRRLFWSHLGGLTPERQRTLLAFICGSGRLPATGALRLRLTCGAPGRLPTSHTYVGALRIGVGHGGCAHRCFNQLVIPRYTAPSDLDRALWRAIDESEGFGIR